MGRGDLSDAEWDLIGPLLPPERGRWARPAGDNRRFLNGMLVNRRANGTPLHDGARLIGHTHAESEPLSPKPTSRSRRLIIQSAA